MQFRSYDSPVVLLAHLRFTDSNGNPQERFFGNRHYYRSDGDPDCPASFWAGRITDSLSLTWSSWPSGLFDRSQSDTVDNISISNLDGSHSDLLSMSVKDLQQDIYVGPLDARFSEFRKWSLLGAPLWRSLG